MRVGCVLVAHDAFLHPWTADLGEVNAPGRISERFLVLGHHGVLDGGRWFLAI